MTFPFKNVFNLEFTTTPSGINMRKAEYRKNMFLIIEAAQFQYITVIQRIPSFVMTPLFFLKL